ncbi:MAG: TIGR01621 family pseudouridine synthase [Oceanospirillaceae bacterium]|nr:TIGR01621 family pseudouridine synthase [Oceanospirillaceae bacterium]
MHQILFNHDDFIIVSKPVSLSVHCDDNLPGFTAQLSKELGTALFVVHRLDRVTSGLMIFAKSTKAAAAFGVLFETHKIGKYYLALSDSKPRKKQGTVQGDMKKSRRSAWMLQTSQVNPAITRFFSKAVSGRRIFLLKPETGKTHQIRVALKSLGSPIIGDPIYSSKTQHIGTVAKSEPSEVVNERCYLHAWQLHFDFAGQTFSFRDDPQQGALFSDKNVASVLHEWSKPNILKWSKNR